MARLYQVPVQNALQYTLDTGYTSGGNALTLNSSLVGIIQAPGVCVVDRIDSSGNLTATKRDYFTFTGVSGQQITGCVGGLAGSTNQDHSVGAIVEFIPDITWAQAIYDVVTQEHSVMGQHASLPSVTQIRTNDIIATSLASIQLANIKGLAVASQASILQANITNTFLSSVTIATVVNASLASIVGFFPSGASGSVLTNIGNNMAPVFAPAAAGGGTGGFNAVFQVPGGLASTANIGGLIPVPVAFTAGFAQAFVQTPASVASVGYVIKKNLNTVFAVGGILAGATFASTASISSAALVAGDVLTLDINSTASLAADLSVLLRAT